MATRALRREVPCEIAWVTSQEDVEIVQVALLAHNILIILSDKGVIYFLDQTPAAIPRKQSLSSIQGSLPSPREPPLPSPRVRIGHSSAFDGVLDGPWTAKRRASEGVPKPPTAQNPLVKAGIKEEEEEPRSDPQANPGQSGLSASPPPDPALTQGPNNPTGNAGNAAATGNIGRNDSVQNGGSHNSHSNGQPTPDPITSGPPPGLMDLTSVEWSYLDPQGQVQGEYTPKSIDYFTC